MSKKIIVVGVVILAIIVFAIPIQFLIDKQSPFHLQRLSHAVFGSEPTPFQPFFPTSTNTPEGYLIQDALVPSAGMRTPSGLVNILLLGSDWRPGSGYRTDVLLLISIYTKEGKVHLLSFPRDLYVQIPGMGQERINVIQASGGFPLTNSTFEYNFGIHLDHYIMTNFSGFQAIIDTLGGIDINAASNLSDRCDLPYSSSSYCSIGPGEKHLDGALALWYVRSRKTTSDFDRTRRAQEVLEGLFRKLMSLDAVARAPELFNLFINNVETDLSVSDILPLIDLAPKILADTNRVQRFSIGPEHVTPSNSSSTNAYVLIPNYELIWQVILQAVYTP